MSNSKKPSESDLEAWKSATSDVKKKNSSKKVKKIIKPKPQMEVRTYNHTSDVDLSFDLPELTAGDLANIDRNTVKRMDRGDYTIDGEIDLHGLSKDEAYNKLTTFINSSFNLGKRMLLIITGKGYQSPDGKSVLKSLLPEWLNAPGLRAKIIRFSQAQPKHGGSGAFYVLLKRIRK